GCRTPADREVESDFSAATTTAAPLPLEFPHMICRSTSFKWANGIRVHTGPPGSALGLTSTSSGTKDSSGMSLGPRSFPAATTTTMINAQSETPALQTGPYCNAAWHGGESKKVSAATKVPDELELTLGSSRSSSSLQ
ncbi:unnamed protein product, partial [Sphagnum troendelagicum]